MDANVYDDDDDDNARWGNYLKQNVDNNNLNIV